MGDIHQLIGLCGGGHSHCGVGGDSRIKITTGIARVVVLQRLENKEITDCQFNVNVITSKAYKNVNAYRPYLIYWQLIGVQYLFPLNTFIFSSESDSLKSEPLIISYKA